MTALLASVMSAAEAETALRGGADIIDFKDPRQGALGALAAPVIRRAVAQVAGRRPTSATVGDLPMEPGKVAAAAARTGDLGVDFVKVGIFPGGDPIACLDALAGEAARGLRLVAVLFADQTPDLDLVQGLAARGFVGVMLDTAVKGAGGLRCHLDEATLGGFVAEARRVGLFTGLAGSLGLADVPALLAPGPDYLGFRGALTAGGRDGALDPAAMAALREAIPLSRPPYGATRASSATATAGAQQAARSRAASSPETRAAKSL
jgi:uncharacterized protein (UPF0264 family)